MGKKIYIALGSTYTSFKREIKPFEGYRVVSRVVGWDRKWVYVLSLFVSGKGKVFATAVSKYVVKKGWLTVHPERVLRASGLYPGGVSAAENITKDKGREEEGEGEEGVVLIEGEGLETAEGIKENVAVDGGVVGEVLDKVKHGKAWNRDEWTWEQIEEERLRGLKVVEGYVGLDEKLLAEWEG